LTVDRPTLIDEFGLVTGDLAPGWTPNWSAPEQVLGSPVTPAADVYPLGVMVVRLLRGRLVGEVRKFRTVPLSDGRDEFDIFYDPFVHVEPKQAIVSGNGLAAWLGFTRSCLAFDPEKRIGTIAEFIDRLEALLREHPLQGELSVPVPGELIVARLPEGVCRVARLVADARPARTQGPRASSRPAPPPPMPAPAPPPPPRPS
jgi:serine/threonine protein kinase